MLDEIDNFVIKQHQSNMDMQMQLNNNFMAIKYLQDLERTSQDIKGIIKHCDMIQVQLKQVMSAQQDLLRDMARYVRKSDAYVCTRGGSFTQESLYPKGHPKRVEFLFSKYR